MFCIEQNRASATLSNTKIKEKANAVTVKAEITALMDPSRFEWDSIHQSLGGTVGQRRHVGGQLLLLMAETLHQLIW